MHRLIICRQMIQTIHIFSLEGKEEMYERRGFTVPLYSTVQVTCKPILSISQLASDQNCDKDDIIISDFNSLTDEIYNFDNCISPFVRNIKWFVETAQFRLVARDSGGRIKGKNIQKN